MEEPSDCFPVARGRGEENMETLVTWGLTGFKPSMTVCSTSMIMLMFASVEGQAVEVKESSGDHMLIVRHNPTFSSHSYAALNFERLSTELQAIGVIHIARRTGLVS